MARSLPLCASEYEERYELPADAIDLDQRIDRSARVL